MSCQADRWSFRCVRVKLTMSDDEHHVEQALRAGACGYLLKDTETDMVIERSAHGGRWPVAASRSVPPSGPRASPCSAPAELPPPFDELNIRERTISQQLGRR
jgi:DNA-binding NarL/FixJ family response regulator